MIIIRTIVGSIFAVLLYWLMLFVPTWFLTGGFDWPRGWDFISVIVALYVFWAVWFLWVFPNPGMVEERTQLDARTMADRFATGLIAVVLLTIFVLIAVDVHRWHVFASVPHALSFWGGLALLLFGAGFITWTFTVNSFVATTVKIQEERGQTVIDTGPYAIVRHPMYAGMIPFLGGAALFLGSAIVALLVLPSVLIGFLPRILIEEATLSRDLPGYADYLTRVRSRIIPGIL